MYGRRIYAGVARLRRLRPDDGLGFRLGKTDETGERAPSRSIRTHRKNDHGRRSGPHRRRTLARRAPRFRKHNDRAHGLSRTTANRGDIDISMAEAIPRTICARHG
jgi:hypothetical protein